MATPMEQMVLLEKATKLLTSSLNLMTDSVPRHGLGNAKAECERCEQIHVFLRCIGKTAMLADSQRLLLHKNATLADAKKAMEEERGNPMRQEDVCDENGFRFSKAMLSEPLWKFSNGCQLTLSFQDDWRKEVGKDAKDIRGTVQDWLGGSSNSTPSSKL